MVANESSSRTILLASLATSVPAMPIARPTSAFFSAGASLVPSPVMATTSLLLLQQLDHLVLVQRPGPGQDAQARQPGGDGGALAASLRTRLQLFVIER